MREAYVYSKYPVLESNMPPVLFAASDLWHEQALKHKLKDNEKSAFTPQNTEYCDRHFISDITAFQRCIRKSCSTINKY
jgi:hypothetical protein